MMKKLEPLSLVTIKAEYFELIEKNKNVKVFPQHRQSLKMIAKHSMKWEFLFFPPALHIQMSWLFSFACFQIMSVKKHSTKYILYKWESGMTGLISLLTNYWLNLYAILNNIYCLKLRYSFGFQHMCSHWEKHNECMDMCITYSASLRFMISDIAQLNNSDKINKIKPLLIFFSWGK